MTRILFYANCLGKGGAHHSALTWFELLRDTGRFELEILCHSESWFTEQLRKRGFSYSLLPMPDALARIRHGQWKNKLRTAWSAVAAVPRLMNAWWHVAFKNPDIVVLTGGRDFIMLFPLALRKRHASFTVPQTTDWGEIPTCKLMCKVAEKTFAISKEVGESIRRMGIPTSKIEVLPMIFTQDYGKSTRAPASLRDELRLGNDGPVLAMAGVVRPHKGQLDAVRVLNFLLKRQLNARLLIIGAPPADAPEAVEYYDRVQRYVADSKLGQHVHFLGWRSDIPMILREANFLLVPSHDYEGVPRVILEGLEAGVPVVGSELPQFKDVLLEAGTGTLCPLDEPERWAEAIDSLWVNQLAYAQARSDARQAWENYYSAEAARSRLLPAIERLAPPRLTPATSRA
ncbi:MAG: glycosyltransferase family 4 protein [Opitutaceae bacterium]|nr:glycosyltransferase family 4 protein [Opitutaceae bacterium]